jgi:hypothetical protein
MDNLPLIQVLNASDSESVLMEIKPQSPEPEVEECCEDNQIREMLDSLGLDFETISQMKTIIHTIPESSCLHCKLEEKVKLLQDGISKLNNEIEKTDEVLKSKRISNHDIKKIVERLEGSIGGPEISTDLQGESQTNICSCGSSCIIS